MEKFMADQSGWTDRFGSAASTLCAIHCAVCALAPAAFAAIGMGFLLSHEAEIGLNLVAIAFGAAALMWALRQHRNSRVITLLAVGIVALVVSRGLEMVSHHGHHEDAHHAGEEDHDDEPAAHSDAKHDDEDKHDSEGEGDHDDGLHLAGAMIGILGGLALAAGHLFNIHHTRRWRDECCD